MSSFEDINQKVEIMANKCIRLIKCGRMHDVDEAVATMLDYIISGEGSLWLTHEDYKDQLMRALIGTENMRRYYMNLVNKPTHEFIMYEMKKMKIII